MVDLKDVIMIITNKLFNNVLKLKQTNKYWPLNLNSEVKTNKEVKKVYIISKSD